MAAAAAPYAGWLAAAAARAAGASAQAKAVASAFEAARAATVHPMLVAANRNAFVQLVLSNLFGQNAPAIAAAEAMYEQMWAADVAAMVGYHGGASAAAAGYLLDEPPDMTPSFPRTGVSGHAGAVQISVTGVTWEREVFLRTLSEEHAVLALGALTDASGEFFDVIKDLTALGHLGQDLALGVHDGCVITAERLADFGQRKIGELTTQVHRNLS